MTGQDGAKGVNMAYVNIKQLLEEARRGKYAVGAFNIFDYLSARAVIEECERQRSPVIIQTSVKTVEQFGAEYLVDIVRGLAQKAGVPAALHLDHCKDVDFAKHCVDCGWSSIMYDGSAYSFEENMKNTKEVAVYARDKNVSVEAELGAIVGVEEDVVVKAGQAALADPELSIQFTKETGVDAFAPAIGTAHGVYQGEPDIDYGLLGQIGESVTPPLVIHGGTGLTDEVFRKLVLLGGAKINISTAIKNAYLGGFKDCMEMKEPLEANALLASRIKAVVEHLTQVFGCAGRV